MGIIAAVITSADPTSKLPSFLKFLHRDIKKATLTGAEFL